MKLSPFHPNVIVYRSRGGQHCVTLAKIDNDFRIIDYWDYWETPNDEGMHFCVNKSRRFVYFGGDKGAIQDLAINPPRTVGDILEGHNTVDSLLYQAADNGEEFLFVQYSEYVEKATEIC